MSPNGHQDRTREGFVGFPLAVTWNTLGSSLEPASQRARRPGGERTAEEKARSAADERARWAMVVPKMDRRT